MSAFRNDEEQEETNMTDEDVERVASAVAGRFSHMLQGGLERAIAKGMTAGAEVAANADREARAEHKRGEEDALRRNFAATCYLKRLEKETAGQPTWNRQLEIAAHAVSDADALIAALSGDPRRFLPENEK